MQVERLRVVAESSPAPAIKPCLSASAPQFWISFRATGPADQKPLGRIHGFGHSKAEPIEAATERIDLRPTQGLQDDLRVARVRGCRVLVFEHQVRRSEHPTAGCYRSVPSRLGESRRLELEGLLREL